MSLPDKVRVADFGSGIEVSIPALSQASRLEILLQEIGRLKAELLMLSTIAYAVAALSILLLIFLRVYRHYKRSLPRL